MAYELEFTNPLDPTVSGEDTAGTKWIYEGTANLAARDKFNGTTFNRPSKLIMTNLLELKDFVLKFVNKKFVTAQYADGSITYAKLASEVKTKFNVISGGGSGGKYTMVARRLQMFTRVYNRDTERSVLKLAINAR